MKVKKYLPAIIIVTVSLVVALVYAFMNNKAKFEDIYEYAFDSSGNLYMTTHPSDTFQYDTILKILDKSSGMVRKEVKLGNAKSEDTELATQYKKICIDIEGNIVLLRYDYYVADGASIDSLTQEYNQSKICYARESVEIYNNDGTFLKATTIDNLAKQIDKSGLPNKPRLVNIEVVGTRIDMFICNDTSWEYRTLDTKDSSEVKTVNSNFKLASEANSTGDYEWVAPNSICATSDGKIVYGTKSGKVYAMTGTNSFENITSSFGQGTEMSIEGIDADNSGNVILFNGNKNTLLSYNVSQRRVNQQFNDSSYIDTDKTVEFSMLDEVRIVNSPKDNLFMGSLKDSEGGFCFFGSGNTEYKTVRSIVIPFFGDINSSTMFGTFVLVFFTILSIGILIWVMVKQLRKKTTIFVKTYLILVPVIVLATVILGLILKESVKEDINKFAVSNQSALSEALSHCLDSKEVQLLSSLSNYGSSDNKKVIEDAMKDYATLVDALNSKSYYATIYAVKDDKIYECLTLNNKTRKANYLEPEAEVRNSLSVTSVNNNRLYDILTSLQTGEKRNSIYSNKIKVNDARYTTGVCTWVITVSAIKDTSGNIIALVENGQKESDMQDDLNSKTQLIIGCILIVNILLLIALFFVLKYILRPIKHLQENISIIGEGNWDARIEVETNDEIGDLSTAFNFMADKMNRYVSSLVLLNKVSMRFLPKEIFQLMGKQKIQDVSLYDKVFDFYNFILVEFPYDSEDVTVKNVYDEYFRKMNLNFNNIFKIVDKNGGILQTYDGRGMFIVAPYSIVDAFNLSIQLQEYFANSNIYQENVKILLLSDHSLIGISGNESKSNVTILSTILNKCYDVNSQMGKLGVNMLITDLAIEQLREKIDFDARFVGKVHTYVEDKDIGLYELISNKEVSEKNIYLQTQKIFEFGVNSYINADVFNARKAFANVLAVNEGDTVAMYYLGLCNDNKDKSPVDWDGKIF